MSDVASSRERMWDWSMSGWMVVIGESINEYDDLCMYVCMLLG